MREGGRAEDVFVDHSAPSADMAATGLLFVGKDIYNRCFGTRLRPLMHSFWRLRLSVKVKACPLSPFGSRDERICVR